MHWRYLKGFYWQIEFLIPSRGDEAGGTSCLTATGAKPVEAGSEESFKDPLTSCSSSATPFRGFDPRSMGALAPYERNWPYNWSCPSLKLVSVATVS